MHFWTLVLKGVYLFSPQGQRVAIFEETISLSFALHLSENNFLFSHYYNSLLVVVALYCHLVTSTSEISHQPAHT